MELTVKFQPKFVKKTLDWFRQAGNIGRWCESCPFAHAILAAWPTVERLDTDHADALLQVVVTGRNAYVWYGTVDGRGDAGGRQLGSAALPEAVTEWIQNFDDWAGKWNERPAEIPKSGYPQIPAEIKEITLRFIDG